ncbi:acetate--CoA ligase family protein [Candidatus Bathyarchaeota archaeon]|nr:acetate--CoA ligase family protein [Candidatus Bathyarchaeota archaeon]
MPGEALINEALVKGRQSLTEPEAKELCKLHGIPTTRFRHARNKEEAFLYAEEIGYPVAIKVVSPDIIHKTEMGAISLGICSPEELRKSLDALISNVRLRSPMARIEGFLVEEMAEPSVELILGALRDPHFGPSVMFGLGGIFVEALGDVSFRVAPVSPQEALDMMGEIRGSRILKGFRDRGPLDLQALSEAIQGVSRLIMEHPEIDQVDLNPLIAYSKGCKAVDARIVLRSSSKLSPKEAFEVSEGFEELQIPKAFEALERLFNPRSVAIFGASPNPGRIGHGIISSLMASGFPGSIYAINPKYSEILGLRSYRNLMEIPGLVDLAVMAIPASALQRAISECISKGVRSIVIISGGFKELGCAQAELEFRIAEELKRHGIRLIGPNCMGILNPKARLDVLFQPPERMLRPKPGSIAFLTQSGTIGCVFLEWAALEGLGVSKFVSYGNRADIDEADLIRYLGRDGETEVIGIYIEGLGNGRKLLKALKELAPKKPIVVLKAGRTKEGSKVARSHTGNLAGTYAIFKGAIRQGGALEAHSLREFFAMLKALALQPKVRKPKPRVAMLTNGAGPCVMVADGLSEAGLSLAELSREALDNLSKRLPSYCIVGNPVDLTGSAKAEDYLMALDILLSDPSVDMVLSFFVFQDPPLEEDVVERFAGLWTRSREGKEREDYLKGGQMEKEKEKGKKTYGKPLLAWASGGPFVAKEYKRLQALGIPVFETPEEILAAAKALTSSPEIIIEPLS